VLAVEKDPLAAKIAQENVNLNAVQGLVTVANGSLEQATGQFDLILINILAEVIVTLAEEGLLAHLRPGGHFIAAGIIEEHESAVRSALEAQQAEIVERLQEKDWVTLVGTVRQS
jgi:ribosomal protein L11 methyltransferase